jgi:hypothetical protein
MLGIARKTPPDGSGRQFARRSAPAPPTVQGPTSYPDRVWLPGCHANSDVAGAFEAVIGRAGTLRREFLMSKVVQLRAAVALRGFALPQHLNLMSSDADDRAGSAGLVIVLAHPDDAVT